MAAFTRCDKCNFEIHDGVEIIADYLKDTKSKDRYTYDYCFKCATYELAEIVGAPKFTKALITKIGIHYEEGRFA